MQPISPCNKTRGPARALAQTTVGERSLSLRSVTLPREFYPARPPCKVRLASHVPRAVYMTTAAVPVALLGIRRGLVNVVAIAWKMSDKLTVEWFRSEQPRLTLPVCWLSE